jgi:multicomponent Na+:H+ antiporter subunit D
MRMPITTACFTIAGFSMIGFPPFNGFVTKWFLALGCLQTADVGSYSAGTGAFAFSMLLLSSFMNLLYYGPVIYHAWFTPRASSAAKSLGAHAASENGDPGSAMLIPLVLIALGIIVFGIFPLLSVNLASGFSQMVFH